MKGIIKTIVISSIFFTASHVMAADDSSNASSQGMPSTSNSMPSSQPANPSSSMWLCTTNASSATSGSSDDQADKSMANTAMSGDAAFSAALKNCRDCTKITCELQTKSNP